MIMAGVVAIPMWLFPWLDEWDFEKGQTKNGSN